MTTPGDESRTELAWREIVEHYGERAVLPDDEAYDARAGAGEPTQDVPPGATADPSTGPATDTGTSPSESEPSSEPPAAPAGHAPTEPLPDHLVDDDEVEVRERAIAASERFTPPPPPPLPLPRTWQRGLAWAGIAVAPAMALLIGLLSLYVPSVVGWLLVAWFVGGFLYLVLEMPRSPRDPWDDGSRV
ncbi:hypothetical protein HN031_19005 [Nocardioides sp. zg-1308]|uniref:hypothetical protein n=1 Tax=Nocardioides TaxID=1839 RepID=UPI0015527D97|nr:MULTISPECIES: hypothetical protein [unclassified Nocardioides]NPD06768.1 hypothetical protein [Nocardioides sp. zg-1308]WQQ20884.1 hypothetical protein SHK17_13330 [Nocardioides sp. S-34]